jgi:hypothetical protein
MTTHTDHQTDAGARTLGFRIAHAAFRRDMTRLERAVSRIEATEDAVAVAAWFDAVTTMLIHHHEVEDDIWWPALSRAVDGFDATSASMVHEHEQLVAALDRAHTALGELAAAPVAERASARRRAEAAATTVARATFDHLDAEEASVFPVLLVAPEDVVTAAEKASAKRDSLRMLRFALPWALDDLDAPLATEVTASLPGVLRIALRRWDRRYRRRFARALALSA